MTENSIHQPVFNLDCAKDEIIDCINMIGVKYGINPGETIHILSEIISEARSYEYKMLIREHIQVEETADSDIEKDNVADVE